jgi:FkbM family methyltransferase
MQRYLAKLPAGVYSVHEVPGLGKFYLDDIDDSIKNMLRRGERWEPYVAKRFTAYVKPGTTAIDVGAHIGTHTLALSRVVGEQGRVYAFEPQKKIFRELLFNMKLNAASNVVPLRFAVGDAEAIIHMSRAKKGNEGGTGIGRNGDRAELRTLDSFPFTNVSAIKIDVEGYEDHVLAGARRTIERNRPVIFIEIQGGNPYPVASPAMRAKIDHTKTTLIEMGYTVERISPSDYVAVPNRPPL